MFQHARVLLLLSVSVVIGCGGGSAPSAVTGTVTYQGSPLPQGTVRFIPVDSGKTAYGTIQPDGAYTMSTKVPGDGLEPGEYTITVEAKRVERAPGASDSADAFAASGNEKTVWLAPKKYSQPNTSGLKKTVEKGKNVIDLALE